MKINVWERYTNNVWKKCDGYGGEAYVWADLSVEVQKYGRIVYEARGKTLAACKRAASIQLARHRFIR